MNKESILKKNSFTEMIVYISKLDDVRASIKLFILIFRCS